MSLLDNRETSAKLGYVVGGCHLSVLDGVRQSIVFDHLSIVLYGCINDFLEDSHRNFPHVWLINCSRN